MSFKQISTRYQFLQHIYHKKRSTPYGALTKESKHDRYVRQKNSRLSRRQHLESDPIAQSFFDWIWSIQEKLRWSNKEFADEIGVSLQTLKLWRNFHGHYPSQKSLGKLLELDKMANVCVTVKVVYGITTSRTILGQ